MRRIGLAVVLALSLVVTPLAAAAEDAATADAVDRAFVFWMTQHGVTLGTLAEAHGSRLVLAKGYGGLPANRRVLIASLSKAITGVCTATLIQQGKLRFDTTVDEILKRALKWYGTPRDQRLRSVTVAQLLTHRAGFGRREDDPATGAPLRDVVARRGPSQATMHDLVPGVLLHQLEHDPGATYEYTNGGHLLLGIAIEAAAGQDYEGYCSDAVLRPQGIAKARLHPTWGSVHSEAGRCPDRSIWRF